MTIQRNQLSTNSKPKFSVAIHSDAYQKLINNTLGDPKIAKKFVADISSVVSNNYKLANCEAGSIIASGLMAQSLNLSMHQGLGFAYLVPYGDKAQFILGYKGYLQLALRSGQYKSIGAYPVYEGEYLGFDNKTHEPLFDFDPEGHDEDEEKPIGFMASFELLNGATKTIYWSREKCERHGKKYSKAYTSFWGKDEQTFQNQAIKTVLRQLISRWGIMSTEMERAFVSDMGVLNPNNDKVDYVDNPNNHSTPSESNVVENEPTPVVDEKTGMAQSQEDDFLDGLR